MGDVTSAKPLALAGNIEHGRAQLATDLAAGVPGSAACRSFSQVYDGLVRSLWQAALERLPKLQDRGFALVALGGWGREEICPFSDIDFVILAEPEQEALAKELAEAILYPLWDAKAKVGHAVRSCSEAAALARDDLPTATALLDARLVVGDAGVFEELLRATRRSVVPGGNANAFLRLLLEERDRRYERYGESLYLLEPNIKQGIGGLRDYSTAHWAARARWSVNGLSGLVALGELSRRQAKVMRDGLDTLLQIRSVVQLEAGRPTDQLSFEIQEAIAPTLFPNAIAPEGRIVAAVAPAVEALMRTYYLAGRGIERVAERVLESATIPARRKPHIHRIDGSFLSWNGKLAVRDPDIFGRRPAEMVRYFWVALEHGLPLYGHTKELIEAQVARNAHALGVWCETPDHSAEGAKHTRSAKQGAPETDANSFGTSFLASNPQACEFFLALLTDLRDRRSPGHHPKTLLRQMHALGLLAALMPAFGDCTGRVQHDLYHVYTVDHHQLGAVEMLKETGAGALAASGGVAMTAYQQLGSVQALYLATLLHDVGKPLGGGHAAKGAMVASGIAVRLGFSDSDVAMVNFLVKQHLTMSHLSQRRDLSDPDVIAKFAALVRTPSALHQLFLLTRCDTAMTAPGNLSSWKDQLLSELYLRTLDALQGSADMESEQALHRRQARQQVVEVVSDEGQKPQRAARANAIVQELEPAFVNALSAEQLARMVECVLSRVDQQAQVEIAVHVLADRGQTEFICASEDSPAVLSHVAGVLAAHRIAIDAASIATIHSPAGPIAIQVFMLRDEHDQPIAEEDRRWARVLRDLRAVMLSEKRSRVVASLLAKRNEGYSVKPNIAVREDSTIKIFSKESSDHSVVEVHTTDAVALLHRISAVMSVNGLDIHRAMVTTEGDRVTDVFYVQDKGRKLSREVGDELRSDLLKVLAS